jgi:hypothetical protein
MEGRFAAAFRANRSATAYVRKRRSARGLSTLTDITGWHARSSRERRAFPVAARLPVRLDQLGGLGKAALCYSPDDLATMTVCRPGLLPRAHEEAGQRGG